MRDPNYRRMNTIVGVVMVILVMVTAAVVTRAAHAEDWDNCQIVLHITAEQPSDKKIVGFYVYLNQVDRHHLVGASTLKPAEVGFDVQDCVRYMIAKKEIKDQSGLKVILVGFTQAEIDRPDNVPWAAGKDGVRVECKATITTMAK